MLRVTPIGARVAAPTALIAAMNTSFIHMARWMSSDSVASTPRARSKAARRVTARSLRDPSSSPNSIVGEKPVWSMRPGADRWARIRHRPPSTGAGPRASRSTSGASIPFRRGTTAVRSSTIGRIPEAASGSCQALTATRTASTGPTLPGSSVAEAGRIVKSPSVLRTSRPLSRIASRCAPRAMNVTSSPASASRPPKYPPTAPAPTTAIRMAELVLSTRRRGARAAGLSGCGGGSRPGPTPPTAARRSPRP